MNYKRKERVLHKSNLTNTLWISKPSLWSLKFMKKKARTIKGVKK